MLSYFWPDLTERSTEVELMDAPSADPEKLRATLRQFQFVNFLFSRSRYLIKKYIIADMLKNRSLTYSLLDIGAGGCDIAVWLSKKCLRNNLNISITCIDRDDRAIRYAVEKCKPYANITVIKVNAFRLDECDDFDYIFSNHFLHHLPDDKLSEIIGIAERKAKKKFLFNDIKRSRPAFLGFTIFGGIFLHNSFAYYDGRLSVRKGFTLEEFRRHTAECSSVTVQQMSPSRIYAVSNIDT